MNYLIRSILPFVIIVTFMLNGCDSVNVGNKFLEKPPSVDVTKDTVFSSPELAKRFLWHDYSTLPYGLPINFNNKTNQLGMDILASLTDLNQSYLKWGGMNTLYYPGQYNAGVENSSGKTKYSYQGSGAWKGIRDAYIFIENIDRVPDMDEQTKKRLKAEARMIIAVHYTDMFRNFGGVPWVDHAYSPNEDLKLPRLTAHATMDSIVATIDKAIPDLPWTVPEPNNWTGRFTQAGAMGLKARVLLFGASPLFNSSEPYMEGLAADSNYVWYGGKDPSVWQDAADAAKALIDKIDQQGGYGLVDTGNPRKDFKDAYYNRGNGEILISTRVRYKSPGHWNNHYYFYQAQNYGIGCTTDDYVKMFPMKSGLPITDPGSGYDPQHPYQNRDPRLYKTVVVNGAPYKNRTAELWIGGRERKNKNAHMTASGYKMRKFALDNKSATHSVVQWPYLRLPEIYLSYAEALNEVNEGPNAEAYKYVNKVRNRVDLGDLKSGMNQKEFRNAVIKERALELGYEKVRWFDLIRWKRKKDFTKKLHGMNIIKNNDGSFTYNRFVLPARYWQNNWSPKWYLSAFPPDEINKGYGLVQNPGW